MSVADVLFFSFVKDPEQPQIDIKQHRNYHRCHQGNHKKLFGLLAFQKGQKEGDQIEQKDQDNGKQSQDTFDFLIHERCSFLWIFGPCLYYKRQTDKVQEEESED